MIEGARYGHTNLIAEDWRALAQFYEQQFGCTPVPPERDLKGRDLERGAFRNSDLRRAHSPFALRYRSVTRGLRYLSPNGLSCD